MNVLAEIIKQFLEFLIDLLYGAFGGWNYFNPWSKKSPFFKHRTKTRRKSIRSRAHLNGETNTKIPNMTNLSLLFSPTIKHDLVSEEEVIFFHLKRDIQYVRR